MKIKIIPIWKLQTEFQWGIFLGFLVEKHTYIRFTKVFILKLDLILIRIKIEWRIIDKIRKPKSIKDSKRFLKSKKELERRSKEYFKNIKKR